MIVPMGISKATAVSPDESLYNTVRTPVLLHDAITNKTALQKCWENKGYTCSGPFAPAESLVDRDWQLPQKKSPYVIEVVIQGGPYPADDNAKEDNDHQHGTPP